MKKHTVQESTKSEKLLTNHIHYLYSQSYNNDQKYKNPVSAHHTSNG